MRVRKRASRILRRLIVSPSAKSCIVQSTGDGSIWPCGSDQRPHQVRWCFGKMRDAELSCRWHREEEDDRSLTGRDTKIRPLN
jgi:hypothetical protein